MLYEVITEDPVNVIGITNVAETVECHFRFIGAHFSVVWRCVHFLNIHVYAYVTMMKKFTFFEIEKSAADRLINSLNGRNFEGIELAAHEYVETPNGVV